MAVEIPGFGDKYSNYVRQLELENADIDYQDFRFSFVESDQYVVACTHSEERDGLSNELLFYRHARKFDEIVRCANALLTIDYTDILAHSILSDAYKAVGEGKNATKHSRIRTGLVQSIIDSGDGITSISAFKVIKLWEEFFVLELLGARLVQHHTEPLQDVCDIVEVEIRGSRSTVYFDISRILAGYEKLRSATNTA